MPIDRLTQIRIGTREHIRKYISKLEEGRRNMDIELFFREKHSILGKIDLAIELNILTKDQASYFLQQLDTIRYF